MIEDVVELWAPIYTTTHDEWSEECVRCLLTTGVCEAAQHKDAVTNYNNMRPYASLLPTVHLNKAASSTSYASLQACVMYFE